MFFQLTVSGVFCGVWECICTDIVIEIGKDRKDFEKKPAVLSLGGFYGKKLLPVIGYFCFGPPAVPEIGIRPLFPCLGGQLALNLDIIASRP